MTFGEQLRGNPAKAKPAKKTAARKTAAKTTAAKPAATTKSTGGFAATLQAAAVATPAPAPAPPAVALAPASAPALDPSRLAAGQSLNGEWLQTTPDTGPGITMPARRTTRGSRVPSPFGW